MELRTRLLGVAVGRRVVGKALCKDRVIDEWTCLWLWSEGCLELL